MATMRRTISNTGERESLSPAPPATTRTRIMDDEKAGKLRQRNESRVVKALLLLGLLVFIFLVAIVKLHHTPKYRSVSVRRRPLPIQSEQSSAQHNALPLSSIYRLSVENKDGNLESLQPYAGMLQDSYQSRGFTVLAFPSNDFQQEYSTNQEIQTFVSTHYPQVTFPIFGISVLDTNPVYQTLSRQLPHSRVQHNFYKYLVNRQGVAVKFYTRPQEPLSLKEDIEALLKEPSPHEHIIE